MNQLSAALNRARSSLEHVNRLLDRLPHRFPNDDERRHHSDSIEEPIIHEYRHEQREPEAGIETTPETTADATAERFEYSEFHAPSPVSEEQSMQPIKKVGLLCGRWDNLPTPVLSPTKQT